MTLSTTLCSDAQVYPDPGMYLGVMDGFIS